MLYVLFSTIILSESSLLSLATFLQFHFLKRRVEVLFSVK